jgi:hypothetical protein
MSEVRPPKLGGAEMQCRAYQILGTNIHILVSIDDLENGQKWLHVSVSRTDQIPSWDILVRVKNIFIGLEEEAIMFFPRQSEYVNLHEYCMHMWRFIGNESKRDMQG